MKKRFILIVLCILLFAQSAFSLIETTESKLKKIVFQQPTQQSPVNNPDLGEGLEYKNFNEGTLPNEAKITAKSQFSFLQTFLNGIYIASIVDLLIPDSIQITNAYNLQYDIINNYITLDSADSLEALKPLSYKLNNIAQTKIQLDENNNVLFVETIPKEEQTFTSPFNEQRDDISINSKQGSKLKIDTSKENKLGIQAQDTTVEVSPKDSLQKKKLIFTIKNGEIIVSEDSGYYKVEGSNVLTSFESISFKQLLDKTKEVEFNSEEGFSFNV